MSYGSYAMDRRNQWMIKNLRVLLEELMGQTLSYSTRELLQNWTESSGIPNSKGESVWRNKKAQKEDRFLRGRQIAYLIYDQFRVTGTHDFVENYADLFTISLRNDDIQEFDSKMGRNSTIDDKNPIWWHLGKLVQIKNTRVSETQDRIGIV